MADGSPSPTASTEEASEREPPQFDEGRYLFCVVRPDDVSDASFSAEGIDGREVGLVVAGDLAAVVQPCESLYDASDPGTVRRWLIRHQSVVDAAGEAFGTPLPFRFDTVIVGGDERVRDWLDGQRGRIHAALDRLAGRWEYRIEVTAGEEASAEALEAEDDRLAALRESIEEADAGRAFLQQKQYEERVRDLRQARREARAEELLARVEPLAERTEWSDGPSTSVLEDTGTGSGDSGERSAPSVSLVVLATPEAADEIGDRLEAVADEPGVEVRYTGPWPPYTFAPEFDAGGDR